MGGRLMPKSLARSSRNMHLSRKYSEQRLEQACCDALQVQKIHYQFIKNLLLNRREGMFQQEITVTPELHHSNVRGPDFYH